MFSPSVFCYAKSTGRNHRLLPALAKNKPPACFFNASRPSSEGGFLREEILHYICGVSKPPPYYVPQNVFFREYCGRSMIAPTTLSPATRELSQRESQERWTGSLAGKRGTYPLSQLR